MYDQSFLDAVALVSFIIGLVNLEENLSQSDKDDIMEQLDKKTNAILERLESDLEKQNEMLREVLEKLGECG